MSDSKLEITERDVEDVTILKLAGQITLDHGDVVLGKTVDGLLARGRLRILVDLAEVTYIDSSGVAMLTAKLKLVQKKGGALKLVNVSARNQRLFATMKLTSIFELFEDEASALGSFT